MAAPATRPGLRDGLHPGAGRATLCISSQVGCALDCSFCSTAQQGFNRNLTAAEIVGQVLLAQKELDPSAGDTDRLDQQCGADGHGRAAGELPQCRAGRRTSCWMIWASISRAAGSRCPPVGLVPQIYKLAEETNVALAVSLHAPDDELRRRTGADQPPASASPSCSKPAGTTSTSRTAAASPSNT